jgi:exoribonuclease-2
MTENRLAAGSLVLYKIRPARVTALGDKIDIELEGGKIKRVRPKDVTLLHPGPVASLGELSAPSGDVDEAWELLEGSETTLAELAELIYGDYTPTTAWGTWELLADGLYFEGEPSAISARSAEQIQTDRAAREAKAAEEQNEREFFERLRNNRFIEEDRKRLAEVERVAFGASDKSRILQTLEHQEKPEHAHRFLVKLGYWEREFNPHTRRLGLADQDPEIAVPELAEEERLDLTHLPAYAIDDEETHDPDDAVSLEGDRIWVHVADVAALVSPDSEIDREARERGANLYLPDRIVHMLPAAITPQLGLGLQEISPALSIGFRLDETQEPTDIQITPSLIRAQRESYGEIDGQMAQEPFASLQTLTQNYRERRKAAGAASLDLPEVSVRVREGVVQIHPLERSASRNMVAETMMMAGEAVARYAQEQEIPIPFAAQQAPEEPQTPEGLAEMYGYRRKLKPSQAKNTPEPHAGLGLQHYCRATSPLRRYLDLVTHQQLRAHLRGETLLTPEQITERIAMADGGSRSVRKGETLSNSHWKMIYLLQNSDWKGEGIVVDMMEKRATVIIPELALETRIRLQQEVELNTVLQLALREVDVPDRMAWFRVG